MTTYGSLPASSSTVSPLPNAHKAGLTAVTCFAAISLVSSTALFLHLSWKLIQYYRRRRVLLNATKGPIDLSHLSFDHSFEARQRRNSGYLASSGKGEPPHHGPKAHNSQYTMPPPNQFLLLLYNLMLADMHQSLGFFLSVAWVAENGVFVGTTNCWAQGWFIGIGDLAPSCFIFAIACHTYLTVVRRHTPAQKTLNLVIIGIWIFIYAATILGPAISHNGQEHGGYYVKSGAWCSVGNSYELLRLVTHYLYIFLSIVLTSILYALVFLHARRVDRQSTQQESNEPSANTQNAVTPMSPKTTHTRAQSVARQDGRSHTSTFLIYPILYLIFTLPVALCRVAAMAGVQVSVTYYCAAGAMIVCNGWLDVLLWTLTRKSLVVGDIDEPSDLGLDTFTFMRTPHGREFGNIVWVQGAGGHAKPNGAAYTTKLTTFLQKMLRWSRSGSTPAIHRMAEPHQRNRRSSRRRHTRSSSQESIVIRCGDELGKGIHMSRVASVVIEEMDDRTMRPAKALIQDAQPVRPSTARTSETTTDKRGKLER